MSLAATSACPAMDKLTLEWLLTAELPDELRAQIANDVASCDADEPSECFEAHVAAWVLAAATFTKDQDVRTGLLVALVDALVQADVMSRWEVAAAARQRVRRDDAASRLAAEVDEAAARSARLAAINELAKPAAERLQRQLTRQFRATLAGGGDDIPEEDSGDG